MEPNDLIGLLESRRIAFHGVIDVRQVVHALDEQGQDPAEAFTTLFHASTAEDLAWRFYALEGMRALAVRGRLREEQADMLLEMTDGVALQMGTDEYYKSISAVAFSPETAPVLVPFVRQKLERRNISDWRWVAFFATAAYLGTPRARIPFDLAQQLIFEAHEETNPVRGPQLKEIAVAALADR